MLLDIVIAALVFAAGCLTGYTYAIYYSKKAQSLKAHVSAEIATLRADLANLLKKPCCASTTVRAVERFSFSAGSAIFPP